MNPIAMVLTKTCFEKLNVKVAAYTQFENRSLANGNGWKLNVFDRKLEGNDSFACISILINSLLEEKKQHR